MSREASKEAIQEVDAAVVVDEEETAEKEADSSVLDQKALEIPT